MNWKLKADKVQLASSLNGHRSLTVINVHFLLNVNEHSRDR